MGLNTDFRFKNWDLAVVSRANIGNYAYNNVASSNASISRLTDNGILYNQHANLLNTGFLAQTEQSLLSDLNIEEASFFKIDNITLGYALPQGTLEGIDVRVYGSVQNVTTVTDYNGLDPEITGGIDNNFYPRPRTYVFGINIDF